MMLFRFVLLVVFALTTVALFYPSSSSSTDKIRLSDVEVLTFYKDSYTTGRRTSARRQIECRSGCNNYFPEELQCYNRGVDGVDVNWECKSNLPRGFRLFNVVVGCEGYDYPMDPYVLRGSCQAIVSLHDDHRGTGYQEFRDGYHNYETRYSEGSQQSSYFWIVILFLGFLFFLYKIFQHFQAQQRVRPQMYASTTPGIPPQYYQTPLGTSNFWSNLGWAGLFGSMFARRGWYAPSWRSRGYWGNTAPSYHQSSYRSPSPRRETQTSYARTERR